MKQSRTTGTFLVLRCQKFRFSLYKEDVLYGVSHEYLKLFDAIQQKRFNSEINLFSMLISVLSNFVK